MSCGRGGGLSERRTNAGLTSDYCSSFLSFRIALTETH